MSNRSIVDPPQPCERFHEHPAKIARIRHRLLDHPTGAALAETFNALGDVTRVRILDALSQAELCVCDLATLLGLTESAVSHQLRLLRSLRVVRSRRAGRMVYYALDDEHVIHLFEQGLRHIEEAAPRAVPGRAAGFSAVRRGVPAERAGREAGVPARGAR